MSNVTKKSRQKKGTKVPRKENYLKRTNSKFEDSYTKNCMEKDVEPYASKANDVAWYAQDPALLRDAASIPYSWPVGSEYDQYNEYYTNVDGSIPVLSDNSNIPGMFIMDIVGCPGISTHNNDAVNIAARNIYGFVRHANSGSSNYDAPDLMLYLLAMDEAYLWYYNAVRAYGIMNLYNNQNRYFPKWAVQALGFDFDDFNSNLAQYRYAINAFATRMASMAVPANMPYFARHKWLYSGIYADGTSAKAQIYAYRPYGYRVYSETGSTGGGLTFKKIDYSTPLTYSKWVEIANDIINPIIGSEDMNIMSGDIIKAYGSEGLIKFESLNDSYTVLPIYNEEVLSQFQNATILYEPKVGTLNIAQDPSLNAGTILFSPSWDNSSWKTAQVQNQVMMDKMINLNLNEVSPSDTMVATRLMNTCIPNEDSTEVFLTQCGTELAILGHAYKLHRDSDSNTISLVDTEHTYGRILDIATNDTAAKLFPMFRDRLHELSDLSRFKFHPYVSIVIDYEAQPQDRKLYSFWEVDNYAIINRETLGRMHDVACLSEFYVYQVAKKYQ